MCFAFLTAIADILAGAADAQERGAHDDVRNACGSGGRQALTRLRTSESWRMNGSMPPIRLIGRGNRSTLIAGLIMLAACSHQLPESERALRASLITVDVAANQGVNFSKFSDLVLDARTKFEIAKPQLAADNIAAIETAISATEEAKAVWQATLNSGGIDRSAYEPLRDLGIVKNNSDFTLLLGVSIAEREQGRADTDKKMVRAALAACAAKVELALKVLPAG